MTSSKPELKPVSDLAEQTGNKPEELSVYLTPAAFLKPYYTAVSAWLDHASFAFWIVEALKPRRFVELGSHNGYSFFTFCQAVQSEHLPTECFAIDLWGGDEHAGFYGDEVFQNVWNHNEAHYAPFARLVRASFDDAVSQFDDGSIDLLHIDGRHFYEDVKHDFETWEPKLSDRAVVLFHDTNVRERGFGVFKFWQEISAGKPAFEFLHGHGLGVLAYGANVPSRVRDFLHAASDEETAQEIRRVYGHLGGVLKTEFAMAQIQAKMNSELGLAEHNSTELQALHTSNVELRASNKELRMSNEELRIAQLELQANHTALTQEISDLQQVLSRLQKDASTAQMNNNRLADSITQLRTRLSDTSAERAHLQALAHDQAVQILRLRQSTSWRITAPLRAIALVPLGLKRLAARTIRFGYSVLPLAPDNKQKVKDLIYLAFGGMVRSSRSYQGWLRDYTRRTEEEKRRKRLEETGTPEAEHARPLDQDPSLALPLPWVTPPASPPKIAVFIHVFFDTLVPEIKHYLKNINQPYTLFITTDTVGKKALIESHFEDWPQQALHIKVVENQGRDIAPKLLAFPDAYRDHDLVLHLHTKKSDHASVLANWRGYLFESLAGSPETVNSILHIFETQADVGMVAAQHFEPARHWVNWGGNLEKARKLASKLGISLRADAPLDFPSGSMFWARSAALKPLLESGLTVDHFDPEVGQIDGTLAHAIERLYFYVAEKAGFTWLKVIEPQFGTHTPAIGQVHTPDELNQWVASNRFSLRDPGDTQPRKEAPDPVTRAPAALVEARQSRALGTHAPTPTNLKVHIGIVTYNNAEEELSRCIASATRALSRAGFESPGAIWLLDNGNPTPDRVLDNPLISRLPSQGNIGFGAGHNALMTAAYDHGCDLYIATNPDGVFHPDCILHLAKMSAAHDHLALIEAMQFPAEHPKTYDPFTFEVPWVSGACLALPKAVYDTIGGFDDTFFMYCEDVDLSWRARGSGIMLRICPAALFQHRVTNRPDSLRTREMIYRSGMILGRKWGGAGFETEMARELAQIGGTPPEVMPVPVSEDWWWLADFDHQFSFAKTRW